MHFDRGKGGLMFPATVLMFFLILESSPKYGLTHTVCSAHMKLKYVVWSVPMFTPPFFHSCWWPWSDEKMDCPTHFVLCTSKLKQLVWNIPILNWAFDCIAKLPSPLLLLERTYMHLDHRHAHNWGLSVYIGIWYVLSLFMKTYTHTLNFAAYVWICVLQMMF